MLQKTIIRPIFTRNIKYRYIHYKIPVHILQNTGAYTTKYRYIYYKIPIHTLQNTGTYTTKYRYIHYKIPVHILQNTGTYTTKYRYIYYKIPVYKVQKHQFYGNFCTLYTPAFYVFCKYWPDDGLLKP